MVSGERTTSEYWEETYDQGGVRQPLASQSGGVRNHGRNTLCAFLERYVVGPAPPLSRPKLLEIGCGDSVFLPYFASACGVQVTGLDYSQKGCESARGRLAAAGVDGEIVCCDFRNPPPELLSSFDIVVSFGVVEHFSDTTLCLEELARFLNPTGTLITMVPNMCGIPGILQRVLNNPVYKLHVPLDVSTLQMAHRTAGLTTTFCEYLLTANFGVVNLKSEGACRVHAAFLRIAGWALAGVTAATWMAERTTRRSWPNRLTSPFVASVAQRHPVQDGATRL